MHNHKFINYKVKIQSGNNLKSKIKKLTNSVNNENHKQITRVGKSATISSLSKTI